MKKAAILVGARPQFIKAAALYAALKPAFSPILIHTGQHTDRQMSGDFFRELDLPCPEYQLPLPEKTADARLGTMISSVSAVLHREKPDGVIVIGDTDSTLAGALCAARSGLFLVHVEAGMRSQNRRMHEEQNRIVTDHLSDLLCCPTEAAVQALQREGLEARAVFTGDLSVDCVARAVQTLKKQGKDRETLARYGVFPGEYALFTMHRAESEENHAQNLQRALEILCRQEIPVLYPVHPRMRPYLEGIKEKMDCRAIRILPPVPYGVLLSLLLHARVCLTDSGTLQKESWLLETPCITLRPETEWPETLLHGWNTLCPAPFDTLPALFAGISRGEIPDRRAQRQPFLGEEAVAARIARVIQKAVTA